MRRVAALALALAVAAGAPSGAAWAIGPGARPDQERTGPLVADLRRAAQLIEKEDFQGALAITRRLVEDPAFASYPVDLRRAVLTARAICELRLSDGAAALATSRVLTDLPGSAGRDWSLRLDAADAAKDRADEFADLALLARRWPAQLADLDGGFLDLLLFRTRSDPSLRARRLEAMQALVESGWRPRPPGTADNLAYEAALAWVGEGAADKAAAAARGIADPYLIVRMRIDRRFDAVLAGAGADVGRAQEDVIARTRSLAEAEPRSLKTLIARIEALLGAGRADEALALADAAMTHDKDGDWNDRADQWNWLLNTRAWALDQLGRWDEAVVQMKAAADLQEHGGGNVSQAINLADLEYRLGRPGDALEAVGRARTENASAYGRAEAALVRACASAQLRDKAGLEAALLALKAEAAANPNALVDGLICAGDEAAAAAALVERIRDPDLRADALLYLQQFRPPAHPTAWDARRLERLAAIRARPEVQAEVARWGRIQAWPVRAPQT